MRIYELAKKLHTSSADLLAAATKLGIEATSPLSRLDDADASQLGAALSGPASAERARDQADRQSRRDEKAQRARARRIERDQVEADALKAGVMRAKAAEAVQKGAPPSETVPQAEAPPPELETETQPPPPEATVGEPVERPAVTVPAEPEAATSAAPVKPRPAAEKPKKGQATRKKPTMPINDDGFEDAPGIAPVRKRDVSARVPRKTVGREGLDREMPGRPARRKAPESTGARKPDLPTAVKSAARKTVVPADRVLMVRGPMLVKELAEMMGLRPNQIIAELMRMNVLASINQRVDLEMASRIAERHGFTVELERQRRSSERRPTLKREDADDAIPEDTPESLRPRPPVVTFLGHVDHGKTSLLDRICNKQVVEGEDGGITQHIGAYTVEAGGRHITFLDTPGHAAFSSMRARGANLTDIAVIVVAADDGIMPQTREAIRFAREADVTLMMAINKTDLPGANADKVRQQLQGEGLTPEEWGGDLVCCEVSALRGDGIDHLLEMILLQADVLELSANPNRRANGFVVEARLEQGRGPTATMLVMGGTLSLGDVVLCGRHWGKVRSLLNDQGHRVKSAGPGIAVQALGLSGVPEAGSEFRVMANEKRARDLAGKTAETVKTESLVSTRAASLDSLMTQMGDQDRPELSIILKGDTQGSLEAVEQSLRDIKNDKVSLNIIHAGIGNVASADIQRATAAQSIIVGFHVAAESGVQALARHHGIKIRLFRIIYELIDQIKLDMLDLLAPEYREVVLGRADVRQVFSLNRIGNVAGSLVTKGVIRASAKVRVLRGKAVRHDGKIESLRHFQDEVPEVREAQECGIRLERFDDFAPGDVIECYHFEELERTL